MGVLFACLLAYIAWSLGRVQGGRQAGRTTAQFKQSCNLPSERLKLFLFEEGRAHARAHARIRLPPLPSPPLPSNSTLRAPTHRMPAGRIDK